LRVQLLIKKMCAFSIAMINKEVCHVLHFAAVHDSRLYIIPTPTVSDTRTYDERQEIWHSSNTVKVDLPSVVIIELAAILVRFFMFFSVSTDEFRNRRQPTSKSLPTKIYFHVHISFDAI
jgi:hypothetical protein